MRLRADFKNIEALGFDTIGRGIPRLHHALETGPSNNPVGTQLNKSIASRKPRQFGLIFLTHSKASEGGVRGEETICPRDARKSPNKPYALCTFHYDYGKQLCKGAKDF